MVLSTSNNGSYKRISGTSMSSAHVTGAVALLLSKKPYLTPYEVIKFIKGSCEPLPGVAKNQQGAGLVRIDKILL
jgi:subtilisin family serine protease